ncbi:hypothetical protein [Saccharopolyspora shandongensis]|uniref:hypothetical protein n=1 Tax=Saccharopolyspora shandongensis TaxID=418495 RepID=UPI0033CA4904
MNRSTRKNGTESEWTTTNPVVGIAKAAGTELRAFAAYLALTMIAICLAVVPLIESFQPNGVASSGLQAFESLISKLGRQCRVHYEDGELQGLEEWVPTRLLACPWGERKALLRDEGRAAR